MEELLSPEKAQEWLAAALAWLTDNVFVLPNLAQLGLVAAALILAWFVRRPIQDALDRYRMRPGLFQVIAAAKSVALAVVALAILWLASVAATYQEWPRAVLNIAVSLLTAWIVIRIVARLVRDPFFSRTVAWIAWIIAALNIVNLLNPTIELLDSAAVTLGDVRISLYTVAKSTVALAVLLWLAIQLSRVLEARIRTSESLSPSLRVLLSKSLSMVLIGLAIIVAVRSVGIDLTALTVIGGAVGLGIGFGLQKIIANLISGVILLLDKSIKPGDVIAVDDTYGWVNTLGGRYVSITTRDGTEHLIPNETLITERVENWTHTNNRTRLKVPVGVHYNSDVEQAIELCIAAAAKVERVLEEPAPNCLIVGFGDNSVDLEVRPWIKDAHNGMANVRSQVYLEIWRAFKTAGIEIPYPQRDLHLRTPADLERLITTRSAKPE